MMNERLQRFVDLMQGIFELDKSDLDFGIYRIINIRKTKIEEFLQVRLPKMVQETLAPFADDNSDVTKRMCEIEKQCADLGIEVSASPKLAAEYQSLKSRKASGTDMSALETDVYSALYSFFNRYYDEGDFISKRRYKEGVYAIPYEGEEVKLYWANQDQYYIKTSENFKDYTFLEQGLTVHFRLVDATTEQNNNKESADSKRVFMLYTENDEQPEIRTFDYDAEKRALIIRFVFDVPADKKRKYAVENYDAIKQKLVADYDSLVTILLRDTSSDPKKPKTVLQKHLDAYVAKNTFDYFIHKDLGGFLRRELDFYIKSEIMHLDDLDTDNEQRVETWLAKVKAIKRVANIIIIFLTQIEEFQKKLWLKKKFVVETNWCMTLDNIREEFWSEIIGNKAQIAEWIAMVAIDGADGWTNPPTVEFLRQNRNLVVDTKHFSAVFRDRLVASIDGLDEKTGGLMIWSDNFQALQLILKKYFARIQTTYIDPPYNTDASPIMYKNGYKDSSWLSMIFDRVLTAKGLMKANSILAFAIDDFEEKYAHCLLSSIFAGGDLGTVAIRNNPSGRPVPTGFAVSHEYTLFFSNDSNTVVSKLERSDELDKRYKELDENGIYMWELLRKRGSDSERKDSPKAYYPIYFLNGKARIPHMEWDDNKKSWVNIESARKSEIVCFPIDENGTERRWRWGVDTAVVKCDDLMYKEDEYGKKTVYYKYRPPVGVTATTSWIEAKYSATEHGTGLLKRYFSEYSPFSFPKSIYAVEDCIRVSSAGRNDIILDFFAGSGTTGHAVLNLNREDNGNRKYILVEMGNYFNTVTKPRMEKVVYSADWKDGKPINRTTGVSHIMKYIRLESYEDALSNVEMDTAQGDVFSRLFGDEYLVRYMMDTETRGSLLDIEAFRNPFAYSMKITENNEAKVRPVDLTETFNYLIGLTVQRQSTIDYFRAILDEQGSYEGAVRLLRDDGGDYAFRQIEGTLPDGRRALVIWRSVTGDLLRSNAALDAYFSRYRINPNDREYDVIYVNGDNNLDNIRTDAERWKVVMTEMEFKQRMFEEE